MKKFLDNSILEKLVEKAIPHLAYELPSDVSNALCVLCDEETNTIGKNVLFQLCENAQIAKNDQVPICQDTGTVRIWLEVGRDICVSGDIFAGVNKAVANAYKNGKLRLSLVKDAINDRSNTGDNTPAFCDVDFIDEPGVARLNIMIKGGGSDNASRVHMLAPGEGKKGIINHIVKCVEEKATSACPPLVLGIGVGATFDSVGSLAQKALFRPLGVHAQDKKTAELEKEILEAVNKTNVGPAGLGGTTVEQVNVETAPCHIASMPLAIDMGCCALRRISIDLKDCLCAHGQSVDEISDEIIDNTLSKAFLQNEEMSNNVVENTNKCSSNLSEAIFLRLPIDRKDLKNLKAGDKVLLSGPIFTLRDAGHIRLLNKIKESQALPYDLDGQTIFYAGPSPAKAGRPFGAIGPTTSSRMDFAAPLLHEKGIVATIGKGKRSKEVHEACKNTASVYFCTIGGCAAYLAKCVKSSEVVAYEDLGTEALRKCEVENFPVYVAIDTQGNDIYDR